MGYRNFPVPCLKKDLCELIIVIMCPHEGVPLSWHWQIIIYETHSHAHIINYYRWVQWSEWLLLSISSQFILPNATATSRFEWWGLKLISPTVDAMLSICIRPSNLFISTWTNPINYLQIAKNTYRHSHHLDGLCKCNMQMVLGRWCESRRRGIDVQAMLYCFH